MVGTGTGFAYLSSGLQFGEVCALTLFGCLAVWLFGCLAVCGWGPQFGCGAVFSGETAMGKPPGREGRAMGIKQPKLVTCLGGETPIVAHA